MMNSSFSGYYLFLSQESTFSPVELQFENPADNVSAKIKTCLFFYAFSAHVALLANRANVLRIKT